MNELFNTIFANTSSELTVSSAAVTMLAALLFGGADKTTTASSGGCAAHVFRYYQKRFPYFLT